MLPRTLILRAAALALALGLGLVAPVGAQQVEPGEHVAQKAKDPRTTRGLFVDPKMPASNNGPYYRKRIGKYAQALWIIPEAYPTKQVKGVVRAYTSRALKAKKTPMLVVYGIPGRDCGSHSSGGALKNAKQYRSWVTQVAAGVARQKAMVIIEPDALPLFSSDVAACPTKPDGWQGMLRFASKKLGRTDAWAYLDAGHSDWRPYDTRPSYLKKAGVQYTRGISTNVSNFRPTADEQAYAQELLLGLRKLGIRGKHYVIDTSRNGAADPVGGDVLNPTWARIGKPPRLVLNGAFDGTLWVKHPGESDGQVNGGSSSGTWCDMLADRLLKGRSDESYCPE